MPHQVEVRVPDVGDSEQVEVIEVTVAVGERVEIEDVIVTLESDKATLELPSPQAGVVQSIAVVVGDEVTEGTLLLVLEVDGEDVVAASPPAATAVPEPLEEPPPRVPTVSEPSFTPSAPPVSASGAVEGTLPHASPIVHRVARELGFDLRGASGSGPHGRVLEEDVKAAVRSRLSSGGRGDASPAPVIDHAKYGEIEILELSRIRRVSARNLARSWAEVPHVTQHDDADITDLEQFRKEQSARLGEDGVRLSPLIFALKATAIALRAFPRMRSSLLPGGEQVVVKNYFHLGVAVDTDGGLVVPVIREVERKGLREIALEVADLAERARARKLRPEHFEGAVFSISSLGGIGGTAFTPLVNHPQVAILGLSRTKTQPRWDEGQDRFVPSRVLPLSLSYDHRVIDGAEAARFTTELARLFGDPAHLLL